MIVEDLAVRIGLRLIRTAKSSNTMQTFTEQIQHFVKRRNLPVEQLATLSNVSRKTLYRWVNGEVERPRHWSQIIAIGKALRLNEDEVNKLLWTTKNPAFAELRGLAKFEYELELLDEFATAEVRAGAIPKRPPGPSGPNLRSTSAATPTSGCAARSSARAPRRRSRPGGRQERPPS
jgi:transcriptional regulator with XRE-family HTH domain